jgi:hypothetical protein
MEAPGYETWHGPQIAAARALAGVTMRELAAAAQTTVRMISDLEARPTFQVSPKRRHGFTSRDLWQRITGALGTRGVVLIQANEEGGAGVRWSGGVRITSDSANRVEPQEQDG